MARICAPWSLAPAIAGVTCCSRPACCIGTHQCQGLKARRSVLCWTASRRSFCSLAAVLSAHRWGSSSPPRRRPVPFWWWKLVAGIGIEPRPLPGYEPGALPLRYPAIFKSAKQDSNLRPVADKSTALTTELLTPSSLRAALARLLPSPLLSAHGAPGRRIGELALHEDLKALRREDTEVFKGRFAAIARALPPVSPVCMQRHGFLSPVDRLSRL